MADTSVLSDFEQPTASNRTEHGAATTRELWTPVKLIALSTADMATSPFAQYNSSTKKQTNKQTDKGQSSTLYSNLLNENEKLR